MQRHVAVTLASRCREEPESFIVLDVSAEAITLTARTVDGEILDDFTLTKKRGKYLRLSDAESRSLDAMSRCLGCVGKL